MTDKAIQTEEATQPLQQHEANIGSSTKMTQTLTTGAPDPFCVDDCPRFPLLHSHWVVQGHSRAGERTGYFIHGPHIAVDCGLALSHMSAVFLTHRHPDHSRELPSMVLSCQQVRKGQEHLKKGRPVVVPDDTLPVIAHLCSSIHYLGSGSLPRSDEEAFEKIGIHPIGVSSSGSSSSSRKLTVPGVPNVVIEVLPGYHGDCQSVGYGFSEIRRRLQSQYAHLPAAELESLRKSDHVDVTEEVEVPQLLIYGDTTPDALNCHEEWKKYPNVFIECTSGDYRENKIQAHDEISSRREHGHSHINELLPIMEEFSEGRRWFLQHLAAKTDVNHLRRVLRASKVSDWTLVVEE